LNEKEEKESKEGLIISSTSQNFQSPGFCSSFVGRLKSNKFYFSSCSTFGYGTLSLHFVNKLGSGCITLIWN